VSAIDAWLRRVTGAAVRYKKLLAGCTISGCKSRRRAEQELALSEFIRTAGSFEAKCVLFPMVSTY
jgi:hypothetical protein